MNELIIHPLKVMGGLTSAPAPSSLCPVWLVCRLGFGPSCPAEVVGVVAIVAAAGAADPSKRYRSSCCGSSCCLTIGCYPAGRCFSCRLCACPLPGPAPIAALVLEAAPSFVLRLRIYHLFRSGSSVAKLADDVAFNYIALLGKEVGTVRIFGPLAWQMDSLFAELLIVDRGDGRVFNDGHIHNESKMGHLGRHTAKVGPRSC